MKIVINRCFGGFGLSAQATKRWAELKGRKCYFFVNPTDPVDLYKYVPVSVEEAEKSFLWYAFDTNDTKHTQRHTNWHEMSMKERKASNDNYARHSLYPRDISRTDPDLIKVVEELGEKANDKHSELAIVEIPDGIEWEITEYDGNERVEEVHRSWS